MASNKPGLKRSVRMKGSLAQTTGTHVSDNDSLVAEAGKVSTCPINQQMNV